MALPKRPVSARAKAADLQQVRQWTYLEVAEWLQDINDGLFSGYVDHQLSCKITGSDLLNLSESDMRLKLGITSVAHITTLTASIERLKKKSRRKKKSSHLNTNGMENKPQRGLSQIPDLDNIPMAKREIHKTHTLPLAMPSDHYNSDDGGASYVRKRAPTAHLKKSKSMHSLTPSLQPMKSPGHKSVRSLHSLSKLSKPASTKNKLKRAHTVGLKNGSNDDEKIDAMSLKRQLTNRNVLSKKRDKFFYKDLGKKLWPKDTSIIIKEGWMRKRGFKRTAFKERWCVLKDNGHLYYFEKRPSANKGLPQGMVDLHDGVINIAYIEDDDPNTFVIKTVNRDWIFSAMSGGQLVEWMSSLNKIVESL